MAIQKEFILRYKNTGHVRFQIPSRASEAEVADRIQALVSSITGVYSVTLFRSQLKLAIHYHEEIIGFPNLTNRLSAILAGLENDGLFAVKPVSAADSKVLNKLKHNELSRWFREKYHAVKETAQAAKLLGKLSLKQPKALVKDPEKAVVDFLNDILVLYLIKLHWSRITQEWLIKPFTHRYEWLAIFYMFYLLVRSRRKR
ncbi:MAG: hypothetical protein ABSB19_04840 [Methylomonas sp.]|jgi:hypothetical protein